MLKPVDDLFAQTCIASVGSAVQASDRMAVAYPRRPSLLPSLTAAEVMRARLWFRDGVNLAMAAFRLGVRGETVRRGTPELAW